MRRGLVLVTLMCLSLVACSTSSSKASTNTLATVAPPPTSNNVAIANAPTTGPGTVTTFEYSAFIDSVDLAAHTITIDPMSFLTGAAAKSAFKQANPSAQEGPPDDYYIVNPTKDHDLLPLSPTAVVRLVDVNGGPHTNPVKVAQTKLVGYPSLTIKPFEISGVNGTVTAVTEIFVP